MGNKNSSKMLLYCIIFEDGEIEMMYRDSIKDAAHSAKILWPDKRILRIERA